MKGGGGLFGVGGGLIEPLSQVLMESLTQTVSVNQRKRGRP